MITFWRLLGLEDNSPAHGREPSTRSTYLREPEVEYTSVDNSIACKNSMFPSTIDRYNKVTEITCLYSTDKVSLRRDYVGHSENNCFNASNCSPLRCTKYICIKISLRPEVHKIITFNVCPKGTDKQFSQGHGLL